MSIPELSKGFTDVLEDCYSVSWKTAYRNTRPYGGKAGSVHNGKTDSRFQAVWHTIFSSLGEYQIQFKYDTTVKLRREYQESEYSPHYYLDVTSQEINLSGEHPHRS